MGRLVYGAGAHQSTFEFEDRLLAHLRIVMVTKLRRQEGYTLSWDLPLSEGSGRVSLWISPHIPLQFRFDGSREPAINRAWIEELATVAASTSGLILLPEPTAQSA